MSDKLVDIGYAVYREHGRNSTSAYIVFPAKNPFTSHNIAADEMWTTIIAEDVDLGTDSNGMASQLTAETVYEVIHQGDARSMTRLLDEAVQQADRAVHRAAQASSSFQRLQATALIAAVADRHLYITQGGRQDVYLVRSGDIQTLDAQNPHLSDARSFGEILFDLLSRLFRFRRSEADRPPAVVITDNQRLLTDDATAANEQRSARIQRSLSKMPLRGGDTVVLCSSELADLLSADEIQPIVENPSLNAAAAELIELARSRQSISGATVVLMRYRGAC